MTDRPDLRASIAALRGSPSAGSPPKYFCGKERFNQDSQTRQFGFIQGAPDETTLQNDIAKLRKAAGNAPLFDLRPAYTDRTLPDLLAEHQLTVLRGAVLKWQIRCRRLEAQVDRLEHELAAAQDEASRLRAACEHSHRATEWGMNEL